MNEAFKTFLTRAELVDAITLDFEQYGPQPELLHEMASLILGNDFKKGEDQRQQYQSNRLRRGKGLEFEPVNNDTLWFYLIHALETFDLDALSMARTAARVFETRAFPGMLDGESGVWIDSQMSGFKCRQCGHCCRNLDSACAQEDVLLWQYLGRQDILAWVREVGPSSGNLTYRVWVDPSTGQTVDTCPFLGKIPGESHSQCMIQEVKPLACREYPFTRKHAGMTGCPGFEPVHAKVTDKSSLKWIDKKRVSS